MLRVLARSVEMWDPLTDRWTERASLLERRGKLGLVTTAGGDILAVAGVSGFRQTDMLGAAIITWRKDCNARWEGIDSNIIKARST